MTRNEFIRSAGATMALAAAGRAFGEEEPQLPESCRLQQEEIDAVTPKMYADDDGKTSVAALKRLDAAFDKVLKEVRETVATDKPAVWFVYNMGAIVKTKQVCFSIDLRHRRATEMAPLLDFALITHNHDDHYTDEFYAAMDGAGKTVVSNFKDNYGGMRNQNGFGGGFTRANKVFTFKDVEIRTSLTDHNGYLVDFTTAFEIKIGDYVIYHSGDCANVKKLNPTCTPDLWFVHPYCGMDVADGVAKFHPKQTVIAHLNELGHARNRWRWTYQDGYRAKAAAEKAGSKGSVPLWGDRIA